MTGLYLAVTSRPSGKLPRGCLQPIADMRLLGGSLVFLHI